MSLGSQGAEARSKASTLLTIATLVYEACCKKEASQSPAMELLVGVG